MHEEPPQGGSAPPLNPCLLVPSLNLYIYVSC